MTPCTRGAGGFVLAVVTLSPDGCDSPSLALPHGTSSRLLCPSCFSAAAHEHPRCHTANVTSNQPFCQYLLESVSQGWAESTVGQWDALVCDLHLIWWVTLFGAETP